MHALRSDQSRIGTTVDKAVTWLHVNGVWSHFALHKGVPYTNYLTLLLNSKMHKNLYFGESLIRNSQRCQTTTVRYSYFECESLFIHPV